MTCSTTRTGRMMGRISDKDQRDWYKEYMKTTKSEIQARTDSVQKLIINTIVDRTRPVKSHVAADQRKSSKSFVTNPSTKFRLRTDAHYTNQWQISWLVKSVS